MYLKNIKAFGFKSFADKTELDLTNGIIGIVGPNGSGKSNIVDAVKWVLGEQSTKNLRANGKMTDVIFSGSKTRPPHTKASITLTFNNEDHYLNCDFNEIEVKRTLYSSGENEYFLNGSKSRLKDITDLFMDSGASKETFNIISQGTVQDIINQTPYDRRIAFEEAAGVLKYKKRKEESIRKLDKTNENLTRINLIINELSLSVEPLRRQSEIANKYLNFKNELEKIEIALLAKDIGDTADEHSRLLKEKENLESKILLIETINKKDTSKIEKLKLSNIKVNEKINELNNKYLKLLEECSKLESDKQIALERKKYEVEDIKLNSNITLLKEEELELKNSIELLEKDLSLLASNLNKLQNDKNIVENDINSEKNRRNSLINDFNDSNKKLNDLENKIRILNNNLDNDSGLSYAARNVLNNPRLKGIHNALGKLIDVEAKYSQAIETALGANQNVIVVDNEHCAKEAINYLKENYLGRATFFPLNIIKPKFIESNVIDMLSNYPGYIDIASNLIKYNPEYDNIIENQLGNIIVAKDIDSLNKIGKLINYRYRIVSLDGEILHTGGSLTGGKNKQTSSVIQDRIDLIQYEKDYSTIKSNIKTLEIDIKNNNNEITICDEKLYNISKEMTVLEEKISIKKESLEHVRLNHQKKLDELSGNKNIKNKTLDKEIDDLLTNYYAKIKQREMIEKDLSEFKKQNEELISEISAEEKSNKEYNQEFNSIQNSLREIEIKLAKLEVKLDNLLLTLNENYQITYESARDKYVLDIEENIARIKVNSLKYEIKQLGNVNIGSIAEFERINKRYTFLTTQANDLKISIDNLEEIITEMDLIMVNKFKDTFNQIKFEFKTTYKTLFKGGEGVLLLTDPNDMLNTGIEIKASPPGKKLNSIGLLSGGEKALTSLALLFAILNVKPAPFCILDEVEDALDDANVDVFGNYINSIKTKTQFIVITHKKRTMEYVDLLYGITMQESGVSKLVSVKLDSIN